MYLEQIKKTLQKTDFNFDMDNQCLYQEIKVPLKKVLTISFDYNRGENDEVMFFDKKDNRINLSNKDVDFILNHVRNEFINLKKQSKYELSALREHREYLLTESRKW